MQEELGLNMYDYGARNYDPALGRWMNIDNLSEKHFNFSPYIYTANNPVLFVDFDGNDYGVTVNRNNKTITISATYISNSKNLNRLDRGVQTYNKFSGGRVFVVGGVKALKESKGKADNYVINYELTTQADNSKSIEGYPGGVRKAMDDKTGTVNSFESVEKFHDPTQLGACASNQITVKEASKDGTASHEIGHSLGNGHDDEGGVLPLSGTNTSVYSTAETLKGVGIGGNNIDRNNNTSIGDGTLLNQSSSEGLENGEVISIRRYERILKRIEKRENKNK